MSGLAGFVDLERPFNGTAGAIEAMTATLVHRGPDGGGTWAGAHAALGFRALFRHSGDRADRDGSLPFRMLTGRGEIAAVCAGEIYNQDELARELGAANLRTRSVHELVAQAYLRWGTAAIARLAGMFAVAIWDGRDETLLLARDQLGVKPLYYAIADGTLLFASEPKGIYAHPSFRPRLDLDAFAIVLQPRLALPGETPVLGMREVPPGHLATFDTAGLREQAYWALQSEPHPDSARETVEHVRDLLEHSVSRAITASGAYGSMLSGGVDSTSVAALAARALAKDDRTLDTCCIRFDTDGEHFAPTELRPDVDAPYAQAAADALGTRHETITATPADLVRVTPHTRQAWDLPGWGQFDASMYLLFEHLRERCSTALTGEAADEFFGGYPYFFKPEARAGTTFPWLGDGPRLSRLLSPQLLAVVRPAENENDRLQELLSRVPRLAGEDPAEARMREVFHLGMAGPLAIILARKDRMSMAHGLSVHVPFCNPDLVQYIWNVPWSMKSAGGVKGLLKAAVSDLVPESSLTRRKSAYPHVQNPAYDAALLDEATAVVNDSGSALKPFFDTTRVNDLIHRIRSDALSGDLPGGASPAYLLIQVVELHHWVTDYQVQLP